MRRSNVTDLLGAGVEVLKVQRLTPPVAGEHRVTQYQAEEEEQKTPARNFPRRSVSSHESSMKREETSIMANAKTLRELFTIREHHREWLDSINHMGTALGLKNGDGAPAILIFVYRKIGTPWLPANQLIPPTLTEPGGLSCPTDVIAGDSDREFHLRIQDRDGGDLGLHRLAELVDTDPLTRGNSQLRDGLRGASNRLTPGSQLAYRGKNGDSYHGTLACFVRDRASGRPGCLTNRHVGDFDGNTLWHPEIGHRNVAIVRRGDLEVPAAERYGTSLFPQIDSRRSMVKFDAGFCELHQDLDPAAYDPRMPTLDQDDQPMSQPLGETLPLDLDSMGPIGKDVVGVGRTRGFQCGTITAFAFEFIADDQRHWSDYLVVGKNDAEFGGPGDSGKLIVTKEGLHPVALKWGGEWARRRHGRELENWTNATDVNWILDRLQVELIR